MPLVGYRVSSSEVLTSTNVTLSWRIGMKRNLNTSMITAAVALLLMMTGAANAAILSVDFNDIVAPVGTGQHQAGFTPWDEGTGFSKLNVGGSGLDVTITGVPAQLGAGMYTRGAAVDGTNAGFTYANLYNDWLFGTTLDFSISGLDADTAYEITWYSYDEYHQGGSTTFKAKDGSDTSGDTIESLTIAASAAPTANDDLAYTGTWTSTTGTLDLTASSAATNIVRVSGFEISAVSGGGGGNAVPEPATATLAMLGLGGLMMRRRRNA
jgi:hypothetical protein